MALRPRLSQGLPHFAVTFRVHFARLSIVVQPSYSLMGNISQPVFAQAQEDGCDMLVCATQPQAGRRPDLAAAAQAAPLPGTVQIELPRGRELPARRATLALHEGCPHPPRLVPAAPHLPAPENPDAPWSFRTQSEMRSTSASAKKPSSKARRSCPNRPNSPLLSFDCQPASSPAKGTACPASRSYGVLSPPWILVIRQAVVRQHPLLVGGKRVRAPPSLVYKT